MDSQVCGEGNEFDVVCFVRVLFFCLLNEVQGIAVFSFFFFFRGMLWHVVCNFPRYERSWVQVNISPIEVRFDFSAEGLCFELIMHHAPPQRVV